MRFILIPLLLVATVFSADFEKSNLRAQLYLGVTPYYPVDFVATGASNLVDKTVVPFQAGFLFSPFYTPAFKLDVPFTIWLGFEAGNWGWADLYDKGNIDSPANNTEKLAWSQWMPSVTGGVSVNLVGDIDLRLLGGVGMTRTTFGHTIIAGHTDNLSYTSLGYFGSVNLEFVLINEMMKNTDLKMAAFVRQDAHNIHNLVATLYDTSLSTGASVRLSNVKFQTIEQTRLKIGVEFSMDFGRESRSDRKKRFKLRDRTNELRKHNTAMDTLTEWDCMAIERDYKFFIASNGDLPNMSEQYTKSQFTDVLESFLAFCQPEDLKTREALYVTLDSNKVQLKTYQMTQEDTRYKQVMASNDVTYLKMFLQYYPKSRYRPGVESKIAVLDDYSAFRTARSGNSYKDYLQYLSNFPEGHYRKEAETGIFALVQAANRQKDYEIYMKKFPTGAYINEARKALHELIKATETGGSRF